MRQLILLLGTPASGKSTFIKNNNLENYTLSADKIRRNLGMLNYTSVSGNNELSPMISNRDEKDVWRIFNKELANQMMLGSTIFVDNMNINHMLLKRYHRLAIKYAYKFYVLDFMTNFFKLKPNKIYGYEPDFNRTDFQHVLNTLKSNNFNSKRTFPVPTQIIKQKLYDYHDLWGFMLNNPNNYNWINIQSPNINMLNQNNVLDFDKYKKVQIIGDIHNDYTALSKVFQQHEPGTAYVFLGDYLDKGNRPYSVFNFLGEQLLGSTNLYFLQGNHEEYWIKYVAQGKTKKLFEKSLWSLKRQYSKTKLTNILIKWSRMMLPYLIFKYQGKTYYCSHAGFEPAFLHVDKSRFNLLPERSFTYGFGNNFNEFDPYNRNIDAIWSKYVNNSDSYWSKDENHNDIYNLHGHRNNFDEFVDGTSINLNEDEKFRWLTLENNKVTPHEIKRIDFPTFDEALKQDPDIWTKKQSNDIISYNYSADAFINDKWNKHTVSARGLFIRKSTHKIVGRGFKKFFENGQNSSAKIDNLTFPVTVTRKHDGWLTLVCYDNKTDKIHIYSKAGETSNAEESKKVMTKLGWISRINKYYEDKVNRDTTLVFETVDPSYEMHVINYTHAHVYPIAIISNTVAGVWLSTKPDNKHLGSTKFVKWINEYLSPASVLTTFDPGEDDTRQAHEKAIENLKQYCRKDMQENPTREGMVLYGKNMMLKVKTPFYHKARELKQAMLTYQKKGIIKSTWRHGAKNWFELMRLLKIKDYTTKLAVKIFYFDKQYNLNKIMGMHHAKKLSPEEIEKIWNNFKND